MNIAILKITKTMWEEIQQGRKKCDVRKLNKDYIQTGYLIVFIDVDSGNYLGTRKVIDKKYSKGTDPLLTLGVRHAPTIEFIQKNYNEEIMLIVFYLEVVKHE